jgi:hypothetical protein
MKILSWILLIFSAIGVLGLLFESNPDSASIWGIVYAGMVIAQSIMILTKKKEV